jgi:hypothetical protein
MIESQIDWYLDFVRHELERLKDNNFSGNLNVKFNWKMGGICNINFDLSKSVKMPGSSS